MDAGKLEIVSSYKALYTSGDSSGQKKDSVALSSPNALAMS